MKQRVYVLVVMAAMISLVAGGCQEEPKDDDDDGSSETAADIWRPEEPRAGAIDDRDLAEVEGQEQTSRPSWLHPDDGLPVAPEGCACSCTITPIAPLTEEAGTFKKDPSGFGVAQDEDGNYLGEAGCREPFYGNYDENNSPELSVQAGCENGEVVDVIWVKTADQSTQLGGSAPLRWCRDNGNNRIENPRRVDFHCQYGDECEDGTACLKAPMCSAGTYKICAYPIVECQGQTYRTAPCCVYVKME